MGSILGVTGSKFCLDLGKTWFHLKSKVFETACHSKEQAKSESHSSNLPYSESAIFDTLCAA